MRAFVLTQTEGRRIMPEQVHCDATKDEQSQDFLEKTGSLMGSKIRRGRDSTPGMP